MCANVIWVARSRCGAVMSPQAPGRNHLRVWLLKSVCDALAGANDKPKGPRKTQALSVSPGKGRFGSVARGPRGKIGGRCREDVGKRAGWTTPFCNKRV